jgi:acyl-CoA reductase-like NAD-dependent aldehyde dehydrogenase
VSVWAPPDFAYAPALESTAAVALRATYGLFVGNEWIDAHDGATFATHNPATEEVLARVACGGEDDVDRAVRAARRGYDKYWRKMRPAERAKYAYRIARALTERSREFAVVETLDAGKPIRQSRDFDVPQAAAHLFYHAGWADKTAWTSPGADRVRALGVVAAIVSSDFPLLAALRKIAPALAAGNTVVLKPAETTPLSALLLAQVCAEADLPPGVLNVVTGDAATGAALATHADLDAVSFAGSTDVGKAIRRATAGTPVRLALELGGKSAIVVYDDAALDQAIEGAVDAFASGGRSASAPSRLLVQENVAGEVSDRLRARLSTLRHGDPLDANTDVGAVVSRARRDAIAEHVAGGVADGATLVQAPFVPPECGFWFPASLLTHVEPAFRIARDEVHGPVLCVMTFRTPAEAIERANNVPFGLSASVWTGSGALALYTAHRLRTGTVWCNTVGRFDPSAPSGGYKESGFGREGGLTGFRAYLQP